MSRESTQALQDQLCQRIDYFRDEFDLTWAEIVGVLEVIKSNLMAEAREIAGDESSDEGEGADA